MTTRTARNYKAMAEQDEHSRSTGRVDLYGVLADMRGKPVVRSLMSPATARRIATELLAAADQAEAQPRVQAAASQRAAEVDVERAARAMHEIPAQPGVYGRIPWARLMEQHREAYRQMARAAASALASENEGVKA